MPVATSKSFPQLTKRSDEEHHAQLAIDGASQLHRPWRLPLTNDTRIRSLGRRLWLPSGLGLSRIRSDSRMSSPRQQHDNRVHSTPNCFLSKRLDRSLLPKRLALTGTSHAGYGASDAVRYVPTGGISSLGPTPMLIQAQPRLW